MSVEPGLVGVAAATPYIGYAAGALTVLSLVPQVGRAYRTRHVGDLSWGLVGHSMGGKVATAAAARRPPGLAGLVLVAPSPPTPEPMTEESRARALASFGQRDAAEETARRITRRTLAPPAFARVVEDSLRTSRRAWDAWMQAGSREDISAVTSAIDVPALVVAGGADPVMDRGMLEREVRGRIRGARMVVIDGVGHLVPYEAPDELAGHVRAFLGAPAA